MSIRVGESWQASNGHRRWVSMPLHDLLIGWGVWAVIVFPFLLLWWMLLAELWLAAECGVLLFTGILVAVALARREARLSGVTLTRLRFGLVMADLRRQP